MTTAAAASPSTQASAEHAAWTDLCQPRSLLLQRELGISAVRVGGTLVLRCRAVPHLLFNRAYDLAHDMDEPQLDRVLASFRDEGHARFMLHVLAGATGARLAPLLQARGLVRYQRRWVRFTRADVPLHLPASDLHVELLHPEHAPEAASVLAPAFDMPAQAQPLIAAALCIPGWHGYFVRVDGQMAGVGVLRVEGEHGHLVMAATLPAYRGRGIQRLLMATRIRRAIALGCTTLSTETGEAVQGEPNPSFHNMLHCGFEPSATIDNWVPEGTTWLAP